MPPTNSRLRRVPLILAAALLAATALFHLTGLSMVAGWFEGEKRAVMILLWIAPAASWLLIAAYWLVEAVKRRAPGWPALLLTAAIPLTVGVPLLALVSAAHPGGYMLVASSLLALASRTGAR
jgi:hypothetical protein